jgi:Zn-dependent peptidase ImmA (M78 family)
VELLIERHMGIDIVPVAGLRRRHHIDAYLAQDLTTIYVDPEVQQKHSARFRFTLAHELGHLVLHKSLYEAANYTDIDGWLEFHTSLTKTHLNRYEGQASSFAGTLLLPRAAFASLIQTAVQQVHDTSGDVDLARHDTQRAVARWVARHAQVSVEAVVRQGIRDGHWAA